MADGGVPAVGDRVLVMRQPWLDLVLSGEKTLELRATRHALGRVWVGMGGKVYQDGGTIRITQTVLHIQPVSVIQPVPATMAHGTFWHVLTRFGTFWHVLARWRILIQFSSGGMS